MSFKEPFRAAPVKLGERYRRKQQDADRRAAVKLMSVAAAVGVVIGTGSVAFNQDGHAKLGAAVKSIAVHAELVRARTPQPGDVWSGCNDARAAGSAPIYFGEPGYREQMDGDGDGVACEPYR